jgi:hypothetical protein
MNHNMTIYDAFRTRHKKLRRDHTFNNGIGFRSLCVTPHIHIMKSAIVFISLLVGAADCFAPRSAPLFTRSASRAERAPTAVRMADLVKVDKPNQQFAAGTAGFVIGAYLGGPILGAHHRPAKLVTKLLESGSPGMVVLGGRCVLLFVPSSSTRFALAHAFHCQSAGLVSHEMREK